MQRRKDEHLHRRPYQSTAYHRPHVAEDRFMARLLESRTSLSPLPQTVPSFLRTTSTQALTFGLFLVSMESRGQDKAEEAREGTIFDDPKREFEARVCRRANSPRSSSPREFL